MIQLPDGSLLLKQGEPMPGYCRDCRRYYPVELQSECSACPECGRETIHAQTGYTGPITIEIGTRVIE